MDLTNSSYTCEYDESLNIAARNWNRIMEAASKMGYKEGIEMGSESVFQDGFDKGYEDGFKNAFILGKYKSLQNSASCSTKYPTDIAEILKKTRQGDCYICKKSKDTNDIVQTEKPLAMIVSEQMVHTKSTVRGLYEYFQPVIQQSCLNMIDP